MHVMQQETDQSWGGGPRGRSVVNLSVWGGGEESHRKHNTAASTRGRTGDTQGPMAHAVPDRTPCRGVAGRGRGRRQAEEFSGGTLGILTQYLGLAQPPPPHQTPPQISAAFLQYK